MVFLQIRIDKKRVQVLEGIQAGMGRLEIELELFGNVLFFVNISLQHSVQGGHAIVT